MCPQVSPHISIILHIIISILLIMIKINSYYSKFSNSVTVPMTTARYPLFKVETEDKKC